MVETNSGMHALWEEGVGCEGKENRSEKRTGSRTVDGQGIGRIARSQW